VWTVVGHNDAVETLRRSLRAGRVAHAYLFTGPAHVGKARLALDLAKALNCTGAEPPCSDCRACRRTEAQQHPDVEWVSLGGLCDEPEHDHARDGSKEIKICQIRRIQRILALRPFEGRARVVILDSAEALNVFACDALLKTLEEPPDGVVLMLLAGDAAALPETIVSRARRVALAPLGITEIREQLRLRDVEPERADLLARLSEGRIGWALAHADDAELLVKRAERLDRLESLIDMSRAERMAAAAGLASGFASARDGVYAYLDLWQSWWRDFLLLIEGCDELIVNRDRLPQLGRYVAAVSAPSALRAIGALRDCRRHLQENANARLALEVLVLRLPQPATGEEVGPS